jgi:hypothetical protein
MPHRKLARIATSDKWRTIAAILAAVLLGVIVLTVVNSIQNNQLAIEKSCILLNNAVTRSLSMPNESTRQLVAEIVDSMDSSERERYLAAVAREQRDREDNPLTVDCEKVAEDPDSIRAIQVDPK